MYLLVGLYRDHNQGWAADNNGLLIHWFRVRIPGGAPDPPHRRGLFIHWFRPEPIPIVLLPGFEYRMREWRHPTTGEIHWRLERRKAALPGEAEAED